MKLFDGFAMIKDAVGDAFPTDILQNLVNGFKFVGHSSLVYSPAEAMQSGLNILILIPVLNFGASFLQMRLQKMVGANPAAGDAATNKSMKFMEYAMPLLIVWMSYSMYAALGLYWIFQSLLGIAQMMVLAKVYPLPKITEEEYELARQQYGVAKKKKKKKPEPDVIETEAEDIDDDEDDNGGSGVKSLGEPEIKDEKYISKTIPKGINENIKNNYKKTGKKYTIKKKKK